MFVAKAEIRSIKQLQKTTTVYDEKLIFCKNAQLLKTTLTGSLVTLVLWRSQRSEPTSGQLKACSRNSPLWSEQNQWEQ